MYGGKLDWIPVVSQVKSAVQMIRGDREGALKTQENFCSTCPLVSQVKSVVEVISGNHEQARQTQLHFADTMSNAANAIPIIGHVKGAVHYACGDSLRGELAVKSASQSTGIIVGGIAGGIIGGPIGAVTLGTAGGAAVDVIVTGVESLIHKEYRPNGSIAIATRVATGKSVKDSFDLEGSLDAEAREDEKNFINSQNKSELQSKKEQPTAPVEDSVQVENSQVPVEDSVQVEYSQVQPTHDAQTETVVTNPESVPLLQKEETLNTLELQSPLPSPTESMLEKK